ncbi:MAG: hypothetical protein K6T78_05920 [Alicyclobacillus sp.]|nr:hypothetical protein [Alicyclobacillus sp.]
MNLWIRTGVLTVIAVIALVVLVVFLSIALKIAAVLALLSVAYYFFTRAVQSRHGRPQR